MTFKLDPNIKMAWTQALRSGEYKQCRGFLSRNDGGHCCLGVLADLTGDLESCRRAMSLNILASDILPHYVQMGLVSMNDRDRKSFDEIADYIEEKL